LGCYGYDKPTSPRLDEFAAQATQYLRVVSTAPWTLPAHASLFTGRYPLEHGARTFPLEDNKEHLGVLPASAITLAEVLSDMGYATGAVIANVTYLSAGLGFSQGFDDFQIKRLMCDVQTTRALHWIEQEASDPFFLFINFMDTHCPYNTAPIAETQLPPASARNSRQLIDELKVAVMGSEAPTPSELVEAAHTQYDRSIANVDAQLGRLFDELKRLGMYDRSLIVITSDHGEYFGEHRLVEHSKDIYQEALFVPLLVKLPGQTQPARIEQRVSLTGVPNLIVGQLPPAMRAECEPAFPQSFADTVLFAETYYARLPDLQDPRWGERFQRVRQCVFEGPWKFIEGSDGSQELYDLEVDPRESNNLCAEQPEIVARLAAALKEQRAKAINARGSARSRTPAEDAELRQLGY
jgi:arylsulfatase A-like enzyme